MIAIEPALAFLSSARNLIAIHPGTWILMQGPLEALLVGWEAAAEQASQLRSTIVQDTKRFSRALSRFAWLHPVYGPKAALLRGEIDWRAGNCKSARAWWTRSLAASHALCTAQGEDLNEFLMFDRALALMALGRTAPQRDERHRCLEEAWELFTRCELPYFQRHAERLLATQPS